MKLQLYSEEDMKTSHFTGLMTGAAMGFVTALVVCLFIGLYYSP